MDEERRKKVEAGKQKLEEFQKRKKKYLKTRLKEEIELSVSETNDSSISYSEMSDTSREMEEDISLSPSQKSQKEVALEESVFSNDLLVIGKTENEINSKEMEETISTDLLTTMEDPLEESVLSDVSLCVEKIQKYKEMIHQRDLVINRLASVIEMQNAANSAENQKAASLKKEFDVLRELVQLQKTSDKSFVCTPTDLDTVPTEDISIQTNITSSSVTEERSQLERSENESCFPKLQDLLQEKSKLQEKVIKLSNCIINSKIPSHSILNDSTPSASCKSDLKSYEIRLLKKLSALNTVARLVESLLNNSSSSGSVTDFTPSKFQRLFLNSLGSNEACDTPVLLEDETQMSDINYAEVEIHSEKDYNHSFLHSVEKLRNINLCDDFSCVTEFLQLEKDCICSEFEAASEILKIGGYDETSSESIIVPPEMVEPSCEVPLEMGSNATTIESVYELILQEKLKLDDRLKHFNQLEKKLQESERNERQKSVESDNLISSEDNLLMEQPALSCLSLLSLTDSECKPECVSTQSDFLDSETSVSRKVSSCYGDAVKFNQEKEMCAHCEKLDKTVKEMAEVIKSFESEKQCLISDKEAIAEEKSKQIELLCKENEMQILHITELRDNESEQLNNLKKEMANYKKEIEGKFEVLDLEKQSLISSKTNITKEMSEKMESLRSESEMHVQQMAEQHTKEIEELTYLCNKYQRENEEALLRIQALSDDVTALNGRINRIMEDKANVEFRLQNEIADLIQDHQQDIESFEKNKFDCVNQEKKKLEKEYLSSIETLKEGHMEELSQIEQKYIKKFDEHEHKLNSEHCQSVSLLEATRSDEAKEYQKKIEQLLEEKCSLLTKTSQDYERILQKNHKTLVNLCMQLLSQIKQEKEKIKIDATQKDNLEASFSDSLNNISTKIENGINKFLNLNYFTNSDEDYFEDDTEYLDFGNNSSANSTMIEEKIANTISEQKTCADTQTKPDSLFDFEDIQRLHFEIEKLQEDFEKDVAMYKSVNQELSDKVQSCESQISKLEGEREKLLLKLEEQEKTLAEKQSQLSSSTTSIKGVVSGSQLSSTDLRSWQVHAAQTNSRLLHVLSDLVKTFLDIEHEINSHLQDHGFIPPNTGNLVQHDEETGQNVGSREDFTSLCHSEGPTLDLTEDGPDLTPRAWDPFSSLGTYDVDTEGEDVVIGASRRLRLAVDHLLNLLTRALDSQQNQDLKVLLKRNEELAEELQHESQTRDSVHYELLNAKTTIRKHEMDKQNLEDSNIQLTESQALLKKELCTEKYKISRLIDEKDSAFDEIRILKEQLELLASRLGDPEKTGNDKNLSSSDSHLHDEPELLQENSKLSSEKQVIQKHHSKERQSLLERLHQMENALDELTAEKEEILDRKCKEITDLKAEMESMEKQCQSNKKFIEEQTLEREQEREEFIKELNKLEEFVREKDKIQSNEQQLTKEIETSEQLLRNSLEERQMAMAKKDESEKELRQALEKIRDLRDVIEELERQLEKKSKIAEDLKQKLLKASESMSAQEKNNLTLKEKLEESQCTSSVSGESIEQLRNLEEQLASRSEEVELMSQNQTLLHELRGQIHFLEAKVDQRAKQLEAGRLVSFPLSPTHSDDTSHSGSQDCEVLHIPCEEGWEMSPRSVHWLEIRRLEEKIGRLMVLDEELIRRNRELEVQLRKMKEVEEENHHENMALQEKVSEQLLQISALRSHLDEQKHRVAVHYVGPSMNEIEELRKCFEVESEKNQRITLELQDTQDMVKNFEEQLREKDRTISVLQHNSLVSKKITKEKNPENLSGGDGLGNENEEPFSCLNLMILEKNEHIDSLTLELETLKGQLDHAKNDDAKLSLHAALEESQAELISKAEALAKEHQKNKGLEEKVNQLEEEVTCLSATIRAAEEQIEVGKIQVETLLLEMGNLMKDPLRNTIAMQTEESITQTETNATELSDQSPESCQNQLRSQTLEILKLKATVAELSASLQETEQELQFAQVQVATLLQELDSLTAYQKKLDEDFDTVQTMVQQKERELAVLQEESEIQLKLESKIEALEQLNNDQKEMEKKLRQKVKELEKVLEDSKASFKEERYYFQVQIKDLTEKHLLESNSFRKRIQVLSRKLKSVLNEVVEDIDVAQIRNQLVEAAEVFKSSDSESKEAFRELVYATLKKAIDAKVSKLKENQEADICNMKETWQQKVNEEITSHQNDMQKKYDTAVQSVMAEKDEFWQNKVREIEFDFEAKHTTLTKTVQDLENLLKEAYTELDSLKINYKNLSEENTSVKKQNEDLISKEQHLLQLHKAEKDNFLKEFKNRLQLAENQMMSHYNQQKQQLESSYRNQCEKLQTELNSRLESEKAVLEARHKEELITVNKFFDHRLIEEVKKFHVLQMEDIKKLKDSKEKDIETVCTHLFAVYDEKLKKIREECQLQVVEERNERYIQHQADLQRIQSALEARFVEEKQHILTMKEKELQTIKEELESRYDKRLLEKREFSSLPENMDAEKENWMKLWEKEKMELMSQHKNEISSLKQEFQRRYEGQMQSRLAARDAEMQKVEEAYNAQLEDARKLLREANRLASMGSRSNSSCVRTATPTSDMTTSSDETCSSCREDILPGNKHNLVNKIHQDGKQVLSLIESRQKAMSAEANKWLEEREWILKNLKSLSKDTHGNEVDLKQIIRNLMQEIQSSRFQMNNISEKEKVIQEQFSQLRQQISIQSSKNHELVSHLLSQKKLNEELESSLTLTKTELSELQRRLATQNRKHLSLLSNEKDYPFDFQGSGDASRGCYSEIEVVRSADTQSSANKFSMFLPEVSSLQKTPASVQQQNWKSSTSSVSPVPASKLQDDKTSSLQLLQRSNSNLSNDKLNLWISNGKSMEGITEAKFHCLFWRYKRSQSYQNTLKYQKKYLLSLLRGFQATEKVTLTWLHLMGSKSDSAGSDAPLRGRSLFRAAAHVLVALFRMKFLVKYWQQRARFPSSGVVHHEVVQNHPLTFYGAGQFLSSDFLASKSASLDECGSQAQVNHSSSDCRSKGESQRKLSKPDNSHLREYVHRLETLHMQLGLQDVLAIPLSSASSSTNGS